MEDILSRFPVKNKYTRKIAREYNSIIQQWTKVDTASMTKEQIASWDMSGLWFSIDVTVVAKAEEYLVKQIFDIDNNVLDEIEEREYQILVAEARKLLDPLVRNKNKM